MGSSALVQQTRTGDCLQKRCSCRVSCGGKHDKQGSKATITAYQLVLYALATAFFNPAIRHLQGHERIVGLPDGLGMIDVRIH